MLAVEEKELGIASRRAGNPAVLLSHPTGNQNVRNALHSLAEHEMLAEFWTTVAVRPQSHWMNLLPAPVRTQLIRRAYGEVPWDRIVRVPFRETVRLAVRTSPLEKLLCSAERPFSIIGMYRHFDSRVARRLRQVRPSAVYAYEGGALQTFRRARERGIKAVYELPSGHWYWERKLLAEEAERNPDFASLHPKLTDSPGHMQWKDEELRLADYVFVPSRHVRNSLAGVVPLEKIRVVNYGAPPVRRPRQVFRSSAEPLKVLFCGTLIQRKGIGYLLRAVDMLGPQVELTLIGTRFAPNMHVDAACARSRWFETLPQDQVMSLMQHSDVLVLPSLSEGFGLVVSEALACGLPVIVTPNVGACDLVKDGREAFVVPVANAEAIAERLNMLIRDRDLLVSMSENAFATASARPWEAYRKEWAETLKEAACN
jgi:alpha-maltose-1-phosphate synthase